MKRSKIACDCKQVTYGEIYDAVKAGADTIEAVSAATGCGLGCRSCLKDMAILIEAFKKEIEEESNG